MAGPTNGGRSQSLQALRDSEELHRAVLEHISDAVFVTDDDGRFTFICPNVDNIFGYVPDEVQAMSRIGVLLGDNLFDRARLDADGEVRNIEREVRSKSGDRRTILIHVKKVAIQGGTTLCACRDVTERKAAEEAARAARMELAQASRLTVAGELVASIVHEITQPMTSVAANASTGMRLLADGGESAQTAPLRDILADILNDSQIARDVIDRLRALTRKQPFNLEVLDLNDVIVELTRLMQGEAQLRGIVLHTDLDRSALKVLADRVGLRQIVLNLLLNAMDAVAHNAQDRRVALRTRLVRNAVELSVSDSGPGIPSEFLPKLFDAFFTTKKEGVGLGLTITRSLVEAQGGQISVADDGDQGTTTFSVRLPPYGH